MIVYTIATLSQASGLKKSHLPEKHDIEFRFGGGSRRFAVIIAAESTAGGIPWRKISRVSDLTSQVSV